MSAFRKAETFIADFARLLLPDADEFIFRGDNLWVSKGASRFAVPFSREDLEDLESVLVGQLPTKYSDGMKNSIRFQICLKFFQERMVPNLRMSAVILDDKRDWLTSVRLITQFDGELALRIYEELQILEAYLNRTLHDHGEIAALRGDLEVVQSITNHYRTKGHLNNEIAGRDSLSFLKAAAVLAIINLEKKIDSTGAERVKNNYRDEILSIVQVFESHPYDQIKLPSALYDYLADARGSGTDPVQVDLAGLVGGDIKHRSGEAGSVQGVGVATSIATDIDELLRSLDPRLIDRRRGAWQALESENPDGVSQAASSMVEVLGRVIELARQGAGQELKDLLAAKLDSEGQVDWVQATRVWITQTKDNLQRLKHHPAAQSKEFARRLMLAAELVIQVVLN